MDNFIRAKMMEQSVDAVSVYYYYKTFGISKEQALFSIENSLMGDTAKASFLMYKDGAADLEWLRKMLNKRVGDVASVSVNLFKDNIIEKEEAINYIEFLVGDSAGAAADMFILFCQGDREDLLTKLKWTKSIIETNIGDIATAAYKIYGYTISLFPAQMQAEWSKKIIERRIGDYKSAAFYLRTNDRDYFSEKWVEFIKNTPCSCAHCREVNLK